MARTSQRAASRELGSSPPQLQSGKASSVSQSPVARATRSNQRQSHDRGESTEATTPRKSTRNTRGASIESAASQNSVDSGRGTKRKATRSSKAKADLSVVAEDGEQFEGEEGEEGEEVAEEEGQANPRSPGELSGMSGTTALTSHSAQELAELDIAMVVEELPELWRESQKILDLLARDASTAHVQSLTKELSVPGSKRAKSLRNIEKKFEASKENYGSDTFINLTFIHRKLFGDTGSRTGDHLPDAVIYAANLAVAVKGILVSHRDNPNTLPLLQRLVDVFPAPVTGTEQDLEHELSEATFDLALELRIQMLITILSAFQDRPDFDPDLIVAQIFYDLPESETSELSNFTDYVTYGTLRKISGSYGASTSVSQETLELRQNRVVSQINKIRDAFSREPEALENGDSVDFDQLEISFPWTSFLSNVIQWSQLRLAEINSTINSQGGIENITQSLVTEMQNLDSQIDLTYEAPQPSRPTQQSKGKSLLPAAEIIPASTSGKSLFSTKNLLNIIRRKETGSAGPSFPPSLSAAQSRAAEPHTPTNQPQRVRGPRSAPATMTDQVINQTEDDFRPMDFDEDQPEPSTQGFPSTREEGLKIHKAAMREKNKENINTGNANVVQQRRLIDRQPNAERVQFDSQNDEDSTPARSRPVAQKRNIQNISDDDITSEDEGFQEDQQAPSNERRATAPVPKSRAPVSASQSPRKRVRVAAPADAPLSPETQHEALLAEIERQSRQREELHLQASARAGTAEAVDEFEPPMSTYREVKEASRLVAQRRLPSKMQSRKPWSEHDSDLLLDAIETYGAGWATIEKNYGDRFERDCEQVALKDKARNMKVDFLRAGIMLPPNFDQVKLGKKEIDKVKAIGHNPYRLEGERPGEESHDMDGIPYE